MTGLAPLPYPQPRPFTLPVLSAQKNGCHPDATYSYKINDDIWACMFVSWAEEDGEPCRDCMAGWMYRRPSQSMCCHLPHPTTLVQCSFKIVDAGCHGLQH